MSMTLKLDTAGLRALIKDTPEFKLQITNAVMNNIKDDHVQESIKRKLLTVIEDLIERRGYGSNTSFHWKSQEFKQLVLTTVIESTGHAIETTAQEAAASYMALNGPKIVMQYLEKALEEQLDSLITEDVVRAALDKKLKAALAAITT